MDFTQKKNYSNLELVHVKETTWPQGLKTILL